MTDKSALNEGFEAMAHDMVLRMTPQRAVILKVIEESSGHLDAETIWKRAKEHDQKLNLATVYRTLVVLKGMGLIDQRYFARKHKREIYESARKPEHYHFTCNACGEVSEFQTGHITELRAELETKLGWKMSHSCLCFEGVCAKCAERCAESD